MAKTKKKTEKKSWSKRMTDLPVSKRVLARLGNEINRLANTAKSIESWPDDEHDIETLKMEISNSLSWLRNAHATAEKIPNEFKPAIRRPQRKLEEGDTVVLTRRYAGDYGFDVSPLFTIQEFIGKRIRVVDNAGVVMLVSRGHVVYRSEA